MPNSTTPSTRRDRQNALKAACLTAGLVTAFAPAPAQATTATPTSGLQAINGDQITPIFDGYYLNASPILDPTTTETPSPVSSSAPASPSGTYGMVVFTQDTTASDLAGLTFESAFLSGTDYTEAEVVNYIQSGMTDTSSTDQNAYNTFLGNFTTDYYSADTPSTDPVNAYEFTNGMYIGTVSPTTLTNSNATSPFAGFGLTPAAVPEPGAVALWLVGAVPLAAVVISRRRRIS